MWSFRKTTFQQRKINKMKTIKLVSVLTLTITSLFGCKAQQDPNVSLITWKEVKTEITKGDIILIDVRTPEEYLSGTVEGAENINFFDKDFKAKFDKFDKEKPIYIFCKSGNRSGKAVKILSKMGFEEIYDIEGGYLAWEK